MPVTPGAVRCEMRETMAPADVGSLCCEWRREPAPPCGILGYPRSTITAVRALCAHVLLRRIWLHKLLAGQCALLTSIPYFFTSLRSLRRRKALQLAIFTALQGAFSSQLLPRIELLLTSRLQVRLNLRTRCVRPCLRGRVRLTLAFSTQLLSLDVPLLLNVPLLLLNIAIDHRRCLLALGRRKIWPRPGWRGRACDVRCRHLRGLRSCNLRPRDLRWRAARSRNVRRCAGCHLWRGRPRGWGRGPCGRRPWRNVWSRTGVSPGVLCGSCHRNGDGQRGCQRHPSTQNHHRPSSTSAELKFRHSTG